MRSLLNHLTLREVHARETGERSGSQPTVAQAWFASHDAFFAIRLSFMLGLNFSPAETQCGDRADRLADGFNFPLPGSGRPIQQDSRLDPREATM
jgi:hypothetical protein